MLWVSSFPFGFWNKQLQKETDKASKHLNTSCHLRIEYRFLFILVPLLLVFIFPPFGQSFWPFNIHLFSHVYLFICVSLGPSVCDCISAGVWLKDRKT